MLKYWLLLHSIPGIGPATFRKLLLVFGEPQNVFSATRKELTNIGVKEKLASSILTPPPLEHINKLLAELERRQIKIITMYDSGYPERFNLKLLKHIKNPPPIIYVQGRLDYLKAIAIIGTTHPSLRGEQKAFRFAFELAKQGFTIVSGYAKGIDTQAHLGAIKGSGKTIIVLPMGILNFKVHSELYPVIGTLFSQSIILSEFFPTAKWTTAQALLRNRITAGLANAVLVVEPGNKGGTISTVRWAKQQNKTSFIVPPINTDKGKEIWRMGAIKVNTTQEIIKLM
ncbi:MAG: DNA-protecting protein DprA [Candidatus Stahlbacteria bacterium]|nr:DNA-protecting protein DprA [Candidatus Stahlbacteria bacterium]